MGMSKVSVPTCIEAVIYRSGLVLLTRHSIVFFSESTQRLGYPNPIRQLRGDRFSLIINTAVFGRLKKT